MTDYAIGDVQGCYDALIRLLEVIQYDDAKDRLWFVGDLVNRGPKSLEVLTFIRSLKTPAVITLGNHDLHLLARIYLPDSKASKDDTLDAVLNSENKLELGAWLKQQPLLAYDSSLNTVMTHAGIPPSWTLEEAKAYAKLLENTLQGDHFSAFLAHMYGNTPSHLHADLPEIDKLRLICNAFTRMRYCNAEGHLDLSIKTKPAHAPDGVYPWYALPRAESLQQHLVFGHWAALEGHCPVANIHAIDTGCVWGGTLTALRLQDMRLYQAI